MESFSGDFYTALSRELDSESLREAQLAEQRDVQHRRQLEWNAAAEWAQSIEAQMKTDFFNDAAIIAGLARHTVKPTITADFTDRPLAGWRLGQKDAIGDVWVEEKTEPYDSGGRSISYSVIPAHYEKGVVGTEELVLEPTGNLFSLKHTAYKRGVEQTVIPRDKVLGGCDLTVADFEWSDRAFNFQQHLNILRGYLIGFVVTNKIVRP